ncbi:hypothetical protein [Radiobacillus sp. PE A8.2]|uniref:hypothetical protein n=1 Tax=Radiobacillus sp. PE A8.2 TaxID=3380349 RepID=UPI00388D74F7
MLDKIKSLSHKRLFEIGLTIIFLAPIIGMFLPFNSWKHAIIQGLMYGIALLIVIIASDKKHKNSKR